MADYVNITILNPTYAWTEPVCFTSSATLFALLGPHTFKPCHLGRNENKRQSLHPRSIPTTLLGITLEQKKTLKNSKKYVKTILFEDVDSFKKKRRDLSIEKHGYQHNCPEMQYMH